MNRKYITLILNYLHILLCYIKYLLKNFLVLKCFRSLKFVKSKVQVGDRKYPTE